MVKDLLILVQNKDQRIGKLQHYLEQLLRQRYGRKSERLEDIDPALLLPFIQDYIKKQAEQNK